MDRMTEAPTRSQVVIDFVSAVLPRLEEAGAKLPYHVSAISIEGLKPEAFWHFHGDSAVTDAAKVLKTLGGKWAKNDPNNGEWDAANMVMKSEAMGVRLTIVLDRGAICEKKVVGTKEVQKKVVLSEETRTVKEDVFEYECKSLLSAAQQVEMDKLAELASA